MNPGNNSFTIPFLAATETKIKQEYARWDSDEKPCFPKPLCTSTPPTMPQRQSTAGTATLFQVNADPSSPVKQHVSNNGRHSSRLARSLPCCNGVRFHTQRMLQVAEFDSERNNVNNEAPQQPHRKLSVYLLSGDSVYSPSSTEDTIEGDYSAMDEFGNEEGIDMDEESIRDSHLSPDHGRTSCASTKGSSRLEESLNLDEASCDLSPVRPCRQRSDGAATSDMAADLDDLNIMNATGSASSTVADVPRTPAWIKLWQSQGEQSTTSPVSDLWGF